MDEHTQPAGKHMAVEGHTVWCFNTLKNPGHAVAKSQYIQQNPKHWNWVGFHNVCKTEWW